MFSVLIIDLNQTVQLKYDAFWWKQYETILSSEEKLERVGMQHPNIVEIICIEHK